MAKAGLLFVGTDDGLVLFSNPNEIGRWLRIGQPFRGHALRAVWAQPDNPLTVLASAEGLGVQRSQDGGQSWEPLFGWAAAAIVGQPQAPGQVFALGDDAVFASRDAGASWEARSVGAAGLGALVAGPRELYVAAGAEVLHSEDAGESWARLGGPLPAPVGGLALHPQTPGLLYAVSGARLYAFGPAEHDWQPLHGAPAARGPLAALPGKQPALLLAAAGGGVARSDDNGASWSSVQAESMLDVLAPAVYHVDVAFAGGQAGQLLISSDRGRSWQVVKQDLPPIRSVAAARLL